MSVIIHPYITEDQEEKLNKYIEDMKSKGFKEVNMSMIVRQALEDWIRKEGLNTNE
jgi:hypothetical protein